jgi:hypothetical protein
MSQPPDRFTTGWYAWDEENSQAVRTADPYWRARWFITVAIIAADGNAVLYALAAPSRPLVAAVVVAASLAWSLGCIWLARRHPSLPFTAFAWRAQLAIGATTHLAMLAVGWWQVAGGQPSTWPRIAAGAAQLVVVIAAGSVYLWAGRAGRQS